MNSPIRDTLDYLGGALDTEPPFLRGYAGFAVRCLVWVLAIIVIYVCSSLTTRFMYVDF